MCCCMRSAEELNNKLTSRQSDTPIADFGMSVCWPVRLFFLLLWISKLRIILWVGGILLLGGAGARLG